MNDLALTLRKLLSGARKIPLSAVKFRNIKRFLRKQSNIHWRPDYLFEDTRNRKFLAFNVIYEAESFTNILSQQVEKVMRNLDLDFFYVLDNETLLDIFEEPSRERGFGVILYKDGAPLLIRDVIKPIAPLKAKEVYVGHYPIWVINDIAHISLGNSKFRTVLKDFSKEYHKLIERNQLDWEKEEKLVKNIVAEIFRSDTRYISGVDCYEILGRFEGFWHDIRDHYFHSFNIFLMGLLIIDRHRDDFVRYYRNIFPKFPDLSLEFVWLLTSIFHDVGYPIAKLDNLKQNIYGAQVAPYEKEVTNVWNDPVYAENLKQLVSLFKFSHSNRRQGIDWPPEVFGTKGDQLNKIFRESFYDSHGVAGCFRFLVDIFSEARREEEPKKRIFLINHIYPAAISIALHDRRFRERLSKIGIKNIKLSRFPFAVLLTYLDSLQEDRRDKYLCIEVPEILQGFKYDGRISAIIDEDLAKDYPRLGKLKAECIDFVNFMECDGIKFEYPEILLT
jgi:hypothetical protein